MKPFIRIFLIINLLVVSVKSFSEGTKQWMPTGMRAGQEMCLMLYNGTDGNERLGTTGCTADERIRIRVSDNFADEVIYIGMNAFANTSTHFRVLDPNGVQVYPLPSGTLQAVLSSGAGNTGEGYIANLTEARNGPEEVFGAGGFDAISISPSMAGDYYIEFNGANSTSYSSIGRHQISYFDVTVANTNGLPEGLGNHTAIDGRLNSFQWSLYNQLSGTGNQATDAEFFLYQADDSLVIAVQWEEVSPGGWDIAFTRDGVQNAGDYSLVRKSQPYTAVGKGSVIGEFPIFFNDPDPNIYPSASRIPELRFLEYDRCSGSTCFLYSITKGGQIEVLIDLNENGVFDPGTSDRLLVDNQPAGTHCLAWDDLDGLGGLVAAGQAQAVIKYQSGIFHMPLGDVEANENGFDRTLVRPTSFLVNADSGRIYYDHSEAGAPFGAGDYDFDGCTVDCNIWDPSDGNQKYLNTWFSYSELRDTLIVTFSECDKDRDGVSDVEDIDDDNDGIPDIVEMYNGDHDNDGTPDYEDAQFCTDVFQGVNGWSCADGLPDPSGDLDGDGIRNAIDGDFPGCGSTLSGACSGYDSDLDGIPDYLDRDSDNDGISDLIEVGGVDTDGDGRVDNLTDTDGDGLVDDYDNNDTDGPNGSGPCANQPGCLQGVSTNPLLDTDNNGVTDNARDSDGDSLADFIDLDSDNDGIPDVVEVGGTDTDGDGYADNFTDTDRDGFNDVVDGQICTDSTDIGTSIYVPGSSTSVDNGTGANGQPDNNFAQLNTLGDLIVLDFGVTLPVGSEYVITWRRKSTYGNTAFADIVIEESLSPGAGYATNSLSPSTDEKANFITTLVIAENPVRYIRLGLVTNSNDDFDLNSVKWYYNEEQCATGNPLLVTGVDGNNDGIPDSYPTDDKDSDGVLNFLDLDSDNDGIPDVVEAGGTDENGDGRADDYVDADNDGFNDVLDGDVGNVGPSENSANSLVLTGADTDNDGVPNSFPNGDFDQDGLYNFLDLEADGDGILDILEAAGTDVDGDGIEDSFTDTDNDGFNDNVDGDPNNSLAAGDDSNDSNTANATTLTGPDTDADGRPNSSPNDDFDGDTKVDFLDIDSDNDGIVDNTEAQLTIGYIAPSNTDADADGIDDVYDGDNALFGGAGSGLTPVDTDAADEPNSPDYKDVDSENDGISDLIEGHDTDGDELADAGSPSNTGVPGGNTDVDNDGLLDGFDNNTSSNDATNGGLQGNSHPNFTNPLTAERDWREIADRDNDGISDAQDIDDDNDGVLDEDECALTPKASAVFQYTGSDQTYNVPAGATEIRAKIWGAGGRGDTQNGRGPGGAGGFTEITIPVSSLTSTSLIITVGQGGNSSTNGNRTYGNGGAGSNGTTNSFRNFGAGGGMSAISYVSINEPDTAIDPTVAVDDIIAIAGGGGTMPAFSNRGTNAGEGGGTAGGDATDGNVGLNGLGGNQVSGGGSTNGDPGGFLYGGNSGLDKGAGGGGYYGGGSGSFIGNDEGGGGGGSAFISNTTRYGQTLRGSLQVPPRNTDPNYIAGAGVGGSTPAGNGGNGLVVIDAIYLNCDDDGDGITNQYDLDSDNDGIPDIIEAGGVDSNDDGRVDGYVDTDNDGWANTFDPDNGGTVLPDEDKDGDGFKNRIDLDADDDGLADIIEAGGVDADGDGKGDSSTDADDDGWANIFDLDEAGTALPIPNTDGDSLSNYLDLDSDNDGITDNIEWQTTANFELPLGNDANNNGWDDRYDTGNGTPQVVSNNDGAGDGPDYIDLNSDNDTQPDWLERADDNEDEDALLDLIAIADAYEVANGNPNHYVSSDDADMDDIPDFLEDADSDGIPNFLDHDNATFYRDSDYDGLVDLYDSDSNGNNRDNVDDLGDLDADGAPDFRDQDNRITLPIELIEFTAIKVGAFVQLDWSTATEINNDYFTIERSIDGKKFEEILTEKGAGNSSSRLDYRRYDEKPQLGYNYYRLSQTDFNGESESFNIEVVNFDGSLNSENNPTAEMTLYPNPTEGNELMLRIDKVNGSEVVVEVMTSEGQLISQQQFFLETETTNYKVEILQGKVLAAGAYYLKVILQDEVNIMPFIVK